LSDAISPFLHQLSKIPLSPITADVNKTRLDLKNHFDEASLQLEELVPIQDTIPNFDTLFFGILDETGLRRPPTREEITQALIAQMHTIVEDEKSPTEEKEELTE